MRLWFRKNTHQQAREAFSEYLDGRLAAGMAVWLEAHLRQCPPCEDEFASMRASVQLVRMMPQAPAPRSFLLRPDQVVQQVRMMPPFWISWLPAVRVAAAATAALFLVVVSVDLFGAGGGTSAQSTSYPILRSQEQADISQQEKQRPAPAAAPSSSQPSISQESLQDGARNAQGGGQSSGAAPQPTLEASDEGALGMPSSSSALRLAEAILFAVSLLLLACALAIARRRQPY